MLADELSPSFLNDTQGVLLLGGIASAVLFGLTSMQMHVYYIRAKQDKIIQRFTVAIVWLLNAAHLAFTTHSLYYYLIMSFANPLALLSATWSINCVIMVTSVVYVTVTVVYSYRIWIISERKWIISTIPFALGFMSAAFGFTVAVKSFQIKLFSSLNSVSWMLYAGFGSAIVCDVCIVFALCFYLRRGRSKSKALGSVVSTLLLYCVSTGALSCVLHIGTFIAYATMSGNFVYIGIYLVTPGLYTNALLVTLNAREGLRSREGTARSLASLNLPPSSYTSTPYQPPGLPPTWASGDPTYIPLSPLRPSGELKKLSMAPIVTH